MTHGDMRSQNHDSVTRFDVSGMGNPLVDILVNVDEVFLHSHNLNKGIMHLIDESRRQLLLDHIQGKNIQMEAGGACPNTMAALGLLGIRVALTGKIGNDELGRVFEEKILQKNVHSFLKKHNTKTGTSIIFITPDKERTMNTHLAANREFREEDLPEEMIENSGWFYFTGYMWDTENQKNALTKALEIAKNCGVQIIFDPADPFAVERYREDFLDLIEYHADIVLANAQESELLMNTDIVSGIEKLGEMVKVAVVKNGAEDTHIYSKGRHITVPSCKTAVKDTTGAGDNFSAGFIYGLIKGLPLELCGKIASFVASKTIEKIGAQVPGNIKELVETLLA